MPQSELAGVAAAKGLSSRTFSVARIFNGPNPAFITRFGSLAGNRTGDLMPTYQYRCVDCRQSFERYQSFTDTPITICPLPLDIEAADDTAATCGGEVRKVFSNVGISFKGSGFYRNDSRSDGGTKSKSSDSSSSSTSDSETKSTPSTSSSSSGSSSSSNGSSERNTPAVGAPSASG